MAGSCSRRRCPAHTLHTYGRQHRYLLTPFAVVCKQLPVHTCSTFGGCRQAKPFCMHAGPQGSSPYHCPMCGVWVSSQPLLEAHFKGRRHLKRALEQADTDAAHMGLQPGTTPEAAAVPRSLPCPPWAFCSLLMCLGQSLSPS